MNRQQIQRLALLAAAKITFVAVPGCERHAGGRGRALSAAPELELRAAASPASAPVEVQVPPPPVQAQATTTPTPAVASSEASSTCAEPPPRETAAPPPKKARTASCDARLTAADNGVRVEQFNDLWACCAEPGMREKHAFCTPWGPPAPPAMPSGWVA